MTKKNIDDKEYFTVNKADLAFIAEKYIYYFRTSAQKNLDSREFHIACYVRAVTDLISKHEPSMLFDLEQQKLYDFDDDRIG